MVGDSPYRLRIETPNARNRRRGGKLFAVSAFGLSAVTGLALGLIGPQPTPTADNESSLVTQSLPLPKNPNQLPAPNPVTADPAVKPAHKPPETTKEAALASIPLATPEEKEAPFPALAKSAPAPEGPVHQVESGDTLAKIFADLGLSAGVLQQIIDSDPEAKRLAKIKPGQKLRFVLDEEGEFSRLTYEIDPVSSLDIEKEGEEFRTLMQTKEVETRTNHTTGVITNSLFADGREAGLADSKIMELSELFGWDIDFSRELRSGDSFTVVYEENYLDGIKFRDGAILAAEFVNQGRTYRAIRYEDPTGHIDYYDPNGNSMHKAFLRSPIEFARISSRFNLGRKHPILGKIRAHKGVDYAAPPGTPIRAAGNGVISFRGRKGGYGKTVIVDHGSGKTTLYAHMSRYASSKKKGTRVDQGQVIGYVGSTGLATGPHLHYEFRLDGVHRDPLKIKQPVAKPIAKKFMNDFRNKTEPLIAQLDTLGRTLVADAR